MLEGAKLAIVIILCLARSTNAKPRVLSENTSPHFHYTNIGDISSKDMLEMADSTSPGDMDTFNTEELDDPYENNIEAETEQYSKTLPNNDSPDLATPRDQEEKFVNLLKEQYRGTFPEYGKETKADFRKNKELEDKVSLQPETEYFGDTDDDKNNFNITPDEDFSDNLAIFDEDLNVLNKFQGKVTPASSNKQTTQNTDDKLREYGDTSNDSGHLGIENISTTEDYEEHPEKEKSKSRYATMAGDNNKPDTSQVTKDMFDDINDKVIEDMEDKKTDHMQNDKSNHMNDHVTDHMADDASEDVTDHMTDSTGDEEKELQKLQEKTDEETLWEAEEKLKMELARKKKNKKPEKKYSSKKLKGPSEGIMKDFDELQKHKKNMSHYQKKKEKNVKNIKYVHAEQSQGDAILDFLDKLLQRDPKQLKHDVLAMMKELQSEGKEKVSSSNKTKYETQSTTTEPLKTSRELNEVDNWISQLENNMDDVKESKEQNASFDDEEYDQFHDQEIYPDKNNDENVRGNEEENAASQQVREEKEREDKFKKEDEFDSEEFKEEALKMHNEYRRRHNAVAFTWSESLAKNASLIAKRLLDATRSSFKQELKKQGENIAILPYLRQNIAKQAVEKWYSEITKFSFTNPSIQTETRNFIQIIWKGSKEVGMGFVHNQDRKKTLVVALYSPAGNDKNKLRENINTVHDDPYADIKRHILKRFNTKH